MLPFFLYIGRFSGTDCQLAGKDGKSCNILLFSGLPCISTKNKNGSKFNFSNPKNIV